jgi:hypothetical protein
VGGLPPATHIFRKVAKGSRASPDRCLTTWDGTGHIPLDAAPLRSGRVPASSRAVNGSKSAIGTGGAASGPASGSKNKEPMAVAKVLGGIAGAEWGWECA